MFRKLKNWKYSAGRDVVTSNLVRKGWPRPEADLIALAMCPIHQERPPISGYMREALEQEAERFYQYFGRVWPDPGSASASWAVDRAVEYLKRYRNLAHQNGDEFYSAAITTVFLVCGLESYDEHLVEEANPVEQGPASRQAQRTEPLRANRSSTS